MTEGKGKRFNIQISLHVADRENEMDIAITLTLSNQKGKKKLSQTLLVCFNTIVYLTEASVIHTVRIAPFSFW